VFLKNENRFVAMAQHRHISDDLAAIMNSGLTFDLLTDV